ncbi:cupin domain-containing protein [Hyalangium versicolor]|uniref:cupin domain-containing protein n=1 Tax=Hyalangium versicolor TaxID=2861190 RepID=UPI001CCBE632|nr:cupin domain-containing protein [Hyalangium versicolor]
MPSIPDVQTLIQKLSLVRQPNGLTFAESYRSQATVEVRGGRAMASAVYSLYRAGQPPFWHRLASDELWFYHGGDPLIVKSVSPEGVYSEVRLGLDVAQGEAPQAWVPAHHWQGAMSIPGAPMGWTLTSAVVVPGFNPADSEELAESELFARFPGIADRLRSAP